MNNNQINQYFKYRKVNEIKTKSHALDKAFKEILPLSKKAKILDIGCGYGETLNLLIRNGYSNIQGIDISEFSTTICVNNKINALCIDVKVFCNSYQAEKFDFIIMSHVLEHISKNEIVSTLIDIRTKLLKKNGVLFLQVPNAQSNTDAYWAFEDFTHTTIFTSGSISFVLNAAGYNHIKFLDPYGFEDLKFAKRILKMFFLKLYLLNKIFWNKITSSAFHKASPVFFSYDLKVFAKNESTEE